MKKYMIWLKCLSRG